MRLPSASPFLFRHSALFRDSSRSLPGAVINALKTPAAGPKPKQLARNGTRLRAGVAHVSDEFVQLGFERVKLLLLGSQLQLGLGFYRLTLLLKVCRGFHIRLGAFDRFFDLRRGLVGVRRLVFPMLDFSRFIFRASCTSASLERASSRCCDARVTATSWICKRASRIWALCILAIETNKTLRSSRTSVSRACSVCESDELAWPKAASAIPKNKRMKKHARRIAILLTPDGKIRHNLRRQSGNWTPTCPGSGANGYRWVFGINRVPADQHQAKGEHFNEKGNQRLFATFDKNARPM